MRLTIRGPAVVRPVAEGVYRISLAWSNAYLLIEGQEAALIDTGLQQDRAALTAALGEVGVSLDQLGAVYLTHAHCDHAGNAAYLAGREAEAGAGNRAALYTHRAEAPYLTRPRKTYAPRGWRRLARPASALAFVIGEWRYPVARCAVEVRLEAGDTIEAPGGPLHVVHSPGHTPGHVAYFRERDGLLFSGDAILNIIPVRRVIGLSLPMALFTEDMALTRRSARRLSELCPTALLAGHGPPLLEDTTRRLQSWVKTLEE